MLVRVRVTLPTLNRLHARGENIFQLRLDVVYCHQDLATKKKKDKTKTATTKGARMTRHFIISLARTELG